MANKKHVKLLEQGSGVWNEWRRQHPEVKPALSGADLRSAFLFGVDLSGADLSGATLEETSLNGAILTETNLTLTVRLFFRA